MTNNPTVMQLRGKILGALLRDARLQTGKSTQEVAGLIGVSEQELERYELGNQAIALPELEMLSARLQMPLEHLLEKRAAKAPERNPGIDPAVQIKLRQRILGAKLRQKRLDRRFTIDDLASQLGISQPDFEAFELGLKPIPIPVLENLCAILGCPMSEFFTDGGISEKAKTQSKPAAESNLPEELHSFVMNPTNRPYIELAIKLSQMSVEKLRTIAESLLEITY